MIPLRVTARFASPLAVPLFPVALDALLASVVCDRAGYVAGVGEWHDVEVPIQRSSCGRFHMASVGHYRVARSVQGHIHKRSPVPEMTMVGSSTMRSINTATGLNKSFRLPLPLALVSAEGMHWWTIADADVIRPLVEGVRHIGKKRSAGRGRVAGWTVEPCEPWPGFPVLRPDGTPMRALPPDYPGVFPGPWLGFGPLSYPYWDQARAQPVVQPPDVEWGPNAGSWYASAHALARFAERHDIRTDCRSEAAVLAFIAEDSRVAKFAHAADDGAQMWVGRRPWRVQYVLDVSRQHQPCPVIATVLPAKRRADAS